ncbi:tyrosine-type recombinase/integrase [Mucilaginibacter angelicae]|uniref:Tyrosine-type recombinase/integrase n=1 Tax=Mucilaginibacter angelicae TaxID=869718 RepID=A0ABV6L1E3_9SPHI
MLTIQQAQTEFLNHCRYEKNLSAKTIKFYTIDLTQFSTFLITEKLPQFVAEVDKHCLKAYLKVLYQWKPKTIKRKIATLKAFFNYLEYEDDILVNPLRKMKVKIKEPLTLPKALTKKETGQFLQSAYHALTASREGTYARDEKIRDAAVVELLFATGARVSEIANLKASDLNLKTGRMTIRGKGNKERIAYICNDETFRILNTYFETFKEKIGEDYLWVNRLGRKLSDQSIRNLVKKLTTAAQLEKHVTPHVFRHTFATLLLENDVDIKYIQSLLGHSSITTTQIYTQVNREKQKQILTDKHPRHELLLAIDA